MQNKTPPPHPVVKNWDICIECILLLVETNNINEGQNGKTPTMNNTHLQVPEEGKLLLN